MRPIINLVLYNDHHNAGARGSSKLLEGITNAQRRDVGAHGNHNHSHSTTTSSPFSSTTTLPVRGRRHANHSRKSSPQPQQDNSVPATITVVTTHPYNPSDNANSLDALASQLNGIQSQSDGQLGAVTFLGLKDVEGKLAVGLQVQNGGGSNCEKLIALAQQAISGNFEVSHALVQCGNGQPEQKVTNSG
ncbi:secreted clade V proteins domain-containing protein [Ditylenchus destructor]|nr:secreted clade V proteins domain-containing protein [Ditylenchus destructor]